MTQKDNWEDWKWQQKNSLRSASDVRKYFPNFPEDELAQIAEYDKSRRWGITPYTLSLMEKDELGNPNPNDPIVKQTFPIRGFRIDYSPESYDGSENVNWELPEELPNPMIQHKYGNKAILRSPNFCLGYCGFCFEVERIEDKKSTKRTERKNLWEDTLQYIRDNPEIQEVIFSGGDPLLVSNRNLERRLIDVCEISSVRAIRFHSRALSFNPFRFDDDLINIFRTYSVDCLGIHICHPNELSEDAIDTLERFNERRYGGLIKIGQIPLLKGINDDREVLKELFMGMYESGIKPYYLFHALPWSPASDQYRTSVRRGVELINGLKRDISNVAMPEYVIVHHKGKHTIPLEINGTPEFQYTQNDQGHPIVRFKNWRGNWETYLDSRDE